MPHNHPAQTCQRDVIILNEVSVTDTVDCEITTLSLTMYSCHAVRVSPRSGTLRASWIEINTHLAPKVPSLKPQCIYIQTLTDNNKLL